MNRRTFIKATAVTGISLGLGSCSTDRKTHILTLSFDDGLKKSFYSIADLFEANGLSACLNVIASGHLPEFQQVGQFIIPELLGDFDDWNTLKKRGHEVMPHSWQHLNLTEQPLEESKNLIVKCLDYFDENLEGYKNSEAVFNFPFNASTPELEQFALSKVLGIRSGEVAESNPNSQNYFRQGCRSKGPENADLWVEEEVNNFLASDGGWLILNLHGLDDESWGPLSTSYLDQLLKRLLRVNKLEILPTGEVMKRRRTVS